MKANSEKIPYLRIFCGGLVLGAMVNFDEVKVGWWSFIVHALSLATLYSIAVIIALKFMRLWRKKNELK